MTTINPGFLIEPRSHHGHDEIVATLVNREPASERTYQIRNFPSDWLCHAKPAQARLHLPDCHFRAWVYRPTRPDLPTEMVGFDCPRWTLSALDSAHDARRIAHSIDHYQKVAAVEKPRDDIGDKLLCAARAFGVTWCAMVRRPNAHIKFGYDAHDYRFMHLPEARDEIRVIAARLIAGLPVITTTAA